MKNKLLLYKVSKKKQLTNDGILGILIHVADEDKKTFIEIK